MLGLKIRKLSYLTLNKGNILKKNENIYFICLFILGLILERHLYETKGFRHFDLSIFISCCVLTFLLCKKIYLKSYEYLSWFINKTDLCFVIICFVILCIPISHISKETKSIQENRNLATYPHFKTKTGINLKYGEQFNSWLSDHFNQREKVIKFFSNQYKINNNIVNKAFYFKKNGWMFNSYPDFEYIEKENLDIFFQNFENFNIFCKQNKIHLYVLVVPHKQMIYQEHIQTRYINGKKEAKFLHIFQKIKNRIGHNLIFPYRELKDAKKNDFVFFKESHHWTEYGAYIGYKNLIKAIQLDFPDTPVISLNSYKKFTNKYLREDWGRDFGIGHTTRILNFDNNYAKKILKDNYVYYDPIEPITTKIQNINQFKTKYYKNQNSKAKYKVFVSGFSQNENMLQFLPYSFQELKYYRLNNVRGVKNEDGYNLLKRYKKDLLDFKPDILILTINPNQLFSQKLWNVF